MASKKAAKVDTLGELHELTATILKEELSRARAAGEGISPQLLAQVIKFLKDNDITADEGNGELAKLKAAFAGDNIYPFDPAAEAAKRA